jgi:hypothetical protein
MTTTDNKATLKSIGIYFILLLALLRFLVYPLHNKVETRKKILVEQKASYTQKIRVWKTLCSRAATPPVQKVALAPYLYEKSSDITSIQLDVVARLSRIAREQGGNMLRFELLEGVPGKSLSEAPLTVWFEGSSQALMEILRGLEETEKNLGVKEMAINKRSDGLVLSLTLSAYRLEQG